MPSKTLPSKLTEQEQAQKDKRWEDAERALRKAVVVKPDYPEAWAKLGRVLSFYLDIPEEGKAHLRKAIELKPDFALAWAQLGNTLTNDLDKSEEGIQCLHKTIELGFDKPSVWK